MKRRNINLGIHYPIPIHFQKAYRKIYSKKENYTNAENQAKRIYVGIGSNLGNKRDNIEKAKFKILQKGIKILASSSLYETLSWPNPNNPKFYNIVLKIETNYHPIDLLKIFKNLEDEFGRRKLAKTAP